MAKNNDDSEKSKAGSQILRHAETPREFSLPRSPGKYLNQIQKHVEQHVGPIRFVYHELLSDLVHLDVLFVTPTPEIPFQILVTSGVSDEPMNVPPGMEKFRNAELMIALPNDWDLSEEALKDENNYWPIRWLKMTGRLPHEFKTWLGWGHSIPNGDPPSAIANTGFMGVTLCPPFVLPPQFFQLAVTPEELVTFYMMVPLYPEEMQLKLDEGGDILERKLVEAETGFVVDRRRKNVAC